MEQDKNEIIPLSCLSIEMNKQKNNGTVQTT